MGRIASLGTFASLAALLAAACAASTDGGVARDASIESAYLDAARTFADTRDARTTFADTSVGEAESIDAMRDGDVADRVESIAWRHSTVALLADGPSQTFVALSPDDTPHVIVPLLDHIFRHYWRDGSGWHRENVDAARVPDRDSLMQPVALRFDAANALHVGYIVGPRSPSICHGRRDATSWTLECAPIAGWPTTPVQLQLDSRGDPVFVSFVRPPGADTCAKLAVGTLRDGHISRTIAEVFDPPGTFCEAFLAIDSHDRSWIAYSSYGSNVRVLTPTTDGWTRSEALGLEYTDWIGVDASGLAHVLETGSGRSYVHAYGSGDQWTLEDTPFDVAQFALDRTQTPLAIAFSALDNASGSFVTGIEMNVSQWDGSSWTRTRSLEFTLPEPVMPYVGDVPSAGVVAIDSHGNPVVRTCGDPGSFDCGFGLATWVDGTERVQFVEGSPIAAESGGFRATLDSSGRVHVAFASAMRADGSVGLTVAVEQPSGAFVLDSVPAQAYFTDPVIAVGSDGRDHVVFRNDAAQDEYAVRDAQTGWHVETIAPLPINAPWRFALSPSDEPHIAYRWPIAHGQDALHLLVRWDGVWREASAPMTLDRDDWVPDPWFQFAVDPFGNPVVVYEYRHARSIHIARLRAGEFVSMPLANDPAGDGFALRIDDHGRVCVARVAQDDPSAPLLTLDCVGDSGRVQSTIAHRAARPIRLQQDAAGHFHLFTGSPTTALPVSLDYWSETGGVWSAEHLGEFEGLAELDGAFAWLACATDPAGHPTLVVRDEAAADIVALHPQ